MTQPFRTPGFNVARLEQLREAHAARSSQYAELRKQGAPPPAAAKQGAYAKALLLRDSLRAAAQRSMKPTPQAVLAILIAESWGSSSNEWSCKMSQDRIAKRLGLNVRSIRRSIYELQCSGLIRFEPGYALSVTRYFIVPQGSCPDAGSEQISEGACSPLKI